MKPPRSRSAQELLSAETALLSSVMKASYDAGLRAQMQPPPAPEPVVSQQPEPPAWQPEPAVPAFGYDAPAYRRKPKRKSNSAVTQMAGSVGGLLIGFLVLMVLRPQFDPLGLFHALPVDQPKQAAEV